jgi:L-asparaginase
MGRTNTELRTIAILSTGGSIAMTPNRGGRREPTLDAADVLARVDDLPRAEYRTRNVSATPSNAATFQDWLTLAREIRSETETGASCVVTHGTDSLTEAAYFCAETMPTVDVVFVGAMRPPGSAGEDGARNLRDATLAAATTQGLGAVVCMNGELLSAWSATKSDTAAVNTFVPRAGGRVARIHDQRVWYEGGPIHANWIGSLPDAIGPDHVPPLVALVPDMDPTWLAACLSRTAQGVVVQTFGGGSIPPNVRPVIARYAHDKEIVLTSGQWSGPVVNNEFYPDTLSELLEAGVHVENVLDSRKARLRLALALAFERAYEPLELSNASGCKPSNGM